MAESYSDGVTTVGELKGMMAGFVGEREWGKFHTPRNLAASVSVEAGELLELFQWLTAEEAAERVKGDEAFRRAVGEEMSDVVMYVVSLANAMGLDLAKAVGEKMEKNRRKYPVEQVRGRYERPVGGGRG
jgi:NTP pyrophosphatase (non-canonical NTP hydrolase)